MTFKLVCNSYTEMLCASGTFSFCYENENEDHIKFDFEHTECKNKNSPFYITCMEYDEDTNKHELVYLHCFAQDIVQTCNKKQANLFKFCY